jgi:hypothetical protein
MMRAPTLARLAVALISVANASAALMLPKPIARATGAATPVAAATGDLRPECRVQRPPRVPRRERARPERADASAGAGEA